MKWSFSINQKAIVENKLSIDIVEAAVFDLLKDFALSNSCQKKIEDGITYFWFSWKIVCDQAPLLNLNTRQSVYKRIDSLVKNKLIDRHPNNQITNQSWYCFGENYLKMTHSEPVNNYLHPVNETLHPVNNDIQPCNQMFTAPVNNRLHNNNINDNNINYTNTHNAHENVFYQKNGENEKVEVIEEVSRPTSKARRSKLKEKVSAPAPHMVEHTFEEDPLGIRENFDAFFQKEYPQLDATFYYMKIRGWCDKKTGLPAKRKVWASTINQFISRDYQDNRLQYAGKGGNTPNTPKTNNEIIIGGLKKIVEENAELISQEDRPIRESIARLLR